MDWIEFTTLLAGIMPDTPLGQIISIRSEENDDVLKDYTDTQKRIRNEWRDKQTQEMITDMNEEEAIQQIKHMFKSMCV